MTWEEMVNSEENEARMQQLADMVKGWGDIVAQLEIREIMPVAEIDIIPDRNGKTNAVFYKGIFSFNTTCAVGVAYYPETHEFASDPFFIDQNPAKVIEPSMDWVQFFLDRVESSANQNVPATGMYMIYENTVHPPIPEKI